jgi:hypothetical protein
MKIHSEYIKMPLLTPPVKLSRKLEDRRARSSLQSALTPRGERRAERRLWKERRATPRLRVEVECEEREGASRYFRITEDLSVFGLSTRQGLSRAVGTRVTLALHLPDGEQAPAVVEAEVVAQLNAEGGMRLAFRKPPVQAVRRIQRFLTGYQRLAKGA